MQQTERKVQPLPAPDRLDSWKEIAAYLNRSERTVRRWEATEELPIHRLQHDKRGSVYAYARELDAWRASRRLIVEDTAGEASSTRIYVWSWVAGALALVAIAVAIVIGLRLRAADAMIAQRGTSNEQAWLAFERARFGDNAGRVQIETGMRYYEQAIQLDPRFARAWAGLATAHMALTWFGERPLTDTMAEARRIAEEARRIDPKIGRPWSVLGWVSHYVDWNHEAAERQFRRGIELTPDAVALSWYGDFLTDMGRFDEAGPMYKRAQAANPRWLEPPIFAANIFVFTGQPALAIVEQRRLLETEPNSRTSQAATSRKRSSYSGSRTRSSVLYRFHSVPWVSPLHRAGIERKPSDCGRSCTRGVPVSTTRHLRLLKLSWDWGTRMPRSSGWSAQSKSGTRASISRMSIPSGTPFELPRVSER